MIVHTWEREDRDVAKILAASGGKLPVVLVNVTFQPEELSAGQLADWERRFELRLLGEAVSGF